MLFGDCTLCRFKIAFSLVAKLVKNLPPMQETSVWRSSGERNANPLWYSCLENPWTEESGGLQSMGSQEADTTQHLNQTSYWMLFALSSVCLILRWGFLVFCWYLPGMPLLRLLFSTFLSHFILRVSDIERAIFFSFENQLEVFLFWFLNIMHICFLL